MSSEQNQSAPQSPTTAQCFSCKGVREVKDGQIVRTDNNRLRLSGTCAACGNKVSKFVPNPDSPKTAASSPSSIPVQKKIQKKKVRKVQLKKCQECLCAAHNRIIAEQPKKERKSPKKKESEELKKRIEELEKHLVLRSAISEGMKDIEEETPQASQGPHEELVGSELQE